MENSATLMSRALSCNLRTMDYCDDQESSWTMYFEDFSAADSQEQSSFSSGFESPSLISDAAKRYSMHQNSEGFSLDKSIIIKMRCSKRMKMVDDSELEDTASSPVSSPKELIKLNQNEGNANFRQARDISQVKEKFLAK